jgi:GDPmannose 4,6-dehydratase
LITQRSVALIFGVSGQDGALLARLMIEKGMEVHGVSRDHEGSRFANLHLLDIFDKVSLHSAAPQDYQTVLKVVSSVRPTRIFNLAAQSSVGLSFDQPVETMDSIIRGVVNIMEAMRFLKLDARLYNAGSSECFGDTGDTPADESRSFHPRSPYGVGKAAAHWAVVNYREAYGLYACSGILFNHESPLRPERYVTQKVVRAAADIAEGRYDILSLGDLSISRDWGWAPEYVEAMRRMLEQPEPQDLIIASGDSFTLEHFVAAVFAEFGLDWRRHVRIDSALQRPSEIRHSAGRPDLAAEKLGWRASVNMLGVAARLAAAEKERRRAGDVRPPAPPHWWRA